MQTQDTFTAADGATLHRYSVPPPVTTQTRARLALLHGYGDHSGRYRHFLHWVALRGVAATPSLRGPALRRAPYVARWKPTRRLALSRPSQSTLGDRRGSLGQSTAAVPRRAWSGLVVRPPPRFHSCAPYLRHARAFRSSSPPSWPPVFPCSSFPPGSGPRHESDPFMCSTPATTACCNTRQPPRCYFTTLKAAGGHSARSAIRPEASALGLARRRPRRRPAAVAEFPPNAGCRQSLRFYRGNSRTAPRIVGVDLRRRVLWIQTRIARNTPAPGD